MLFFASLQHQNTSQNKIADNFSSYGQKIKIFFFSSKTTVNPYQNLDTLGGGKKQKKKGDFHDQNLDADIFSPIRGTTIILTGY